jgi:integrase
VSARRWYRKHVEEYIRAHSEVKLQHHQPQHVDKYLTVKGRLPQIREWQFRQIADALRLLFCELIQLEWADQYDWYRWRAYAKELESDHPTLLRDANPNVLVAPNNNPLVKRFREEYAALHLDFVKTIRVRRMAARTEKTYEHWVGALALVFTHTRANAKRRRPTVLPRSEVKSLLDSMNGRSKLMASLMYGTGMRVMECVGLRVKDIDLDYQQITIRSGKGGKERVVPLPQRLAPDLRNYLEPVIQHHQKQI